MGTGFAWRFALRWRAVVVCRRHAVLQALWDELRFRHYGKLDDTPDPTLPWRAALLFVETIDTNVCHDLIGILPQILLEGADQALKLGFEWRTGYLGRDADQLFWNDLRGQGLRAPDLAAVARAHLPRLKCLFESLHVSLLNVVAAELRPVYESLALQIFSVESDGD